MKNMENQKPQEKKEKPPFLYHGSSHKTEELEPRTKPHRTEEGPLVFATQDITTASAFMAENMAMTGGFDVEGERVLYGVIVGNREEFLQKDKGGHIYVLLSDDFEPYNGKGMQGYEWVSKSKVKPIKTIEYNSSLDGMLKNGVQVFFVDENTFQEIRKAKDYGYSIFKSLQSENQRRGINVKEFK